MKAPKKLYRVVPIVFFQYFPQEAPSLDESDEYENIYLVFISQIAQLSQQTLLRNNKNKSLN